MKRAKIYPNIKINSFATEIAWLQLYRTFNVKEIPKDLEKNRMK